MGVRSPVRRFLKRSQVMRLRERLAPRRDHAAAAGTPRPRIFFIGPNKTGTNSLHDWMRRSGISSVHFGGYEPKNNLAVRMYANVSARRPVLAGIDGYEAYSDLNFNRDGIYLDGGRLFRQLHAEHPDAYFVLNVRPADTWVASRARHSRGTHARRMALALDVPVAKLQDVDRHLLDTQRTDARAYFDARGGRFLEFDIASDAPETLAGFLAPDYSLDPAALRRRNRTTAPPAATAGTGREPEVH